MSAARRCDACGAVGEPPYAGWLTVTSFVQRDTTSIWEMRTPKLKLDVCGHGCLPQLAFVKLDDFLAVAEETA